MERLCIAFSGDDPNYFLKILENLLETGGAMVWPDPCSSMAAVVDIPDYFPRETALAAIERCGFRVVSEVEQSEAAQLEFRFARRLFPVN